VTIPEQKTLISAQRANPISRRDEQNNIDTAPAPLRQETRCHSGLPMEDLTGC
jgi:hypothetical protein